MRTCACVCVCVFGFHSKERKVNYDRTHSLKFDVYAFNGEREGKIVKIKREQLIVKKKNLPLDETDEYMYTCLIRRTRERNEHHHGYLN